MNDTPQTRYSPCGKYSLHIHTLINEGWNSKHIEIHRVGGGEIGKTTRNFYNDEILHFVYQDGRDYLIISEDYHGGYGCVDLLTGEQAIYSPTPKQKNEQFWCWAYPLGHDAENKTLIIGGCYWAAPYERATFDFSKPMEVPYPEISVETEPLDEDDTP